MIDEPCPCGSKLRRIDDIEGRADDVFVYDSGLIVHPLSFRSILGGERHGVEYQVRQTVDGASLALRADGDRPRAALPIFKRERIGCHDWGLGESDRWFHDVLQADGTPYDADEVVLSRGVIGARA